MSSISKYINSGWLWAFWLFAITPVVLASVTIVANASDVSATWDAARIVIPPNVTKSGRGCEGLKSTPYNTKCLNDIRDDTKFPVILYMHGCAGFFGIEGRELLLLGKHGLPIFAPDSFARPNRKQNCRPMANKRAIMRLRFAEVDYAIDKLAELPWVDKTRIILMGFSEGGCTTSLSPTTVPAARVVLGWTCQSLDPWWRGIRGSKKTPVLSVVGNRDRYHQNRSNRGDCGKFLRRRPHSKSVIIRGADHEIVGLAETQDAIAQFLTAVLGDAYPGRE